MDDQQMSDRSGRTSAVDTVRVLGRVRRLRASSLRPDGDTGVSSFDLDDYLPEEAADAIRRVRLPLAGVLVVGVLCEIAPSAPWALIIPALLAAALLRLDRHIGFGFAEGIIGYRGRFVWPRGVQEEDPVHWDWRPAGRVAAAGPERQVD